MASNTLRKQITDFIINSQRILILPSSPLDGDSLGSALALYLILKKLGKEPTVVSSSHVPNIYNFLPTIGVINDKISASKDFIISLDLSNAQLFDIKSLIDKDKAHIIITPKSGRLSEKDVSFSYGPDKYDLVITVDTAAQEQLGTIYEDNIDMFTQLPVINIDHHISNDQFGRINFVDYMSSSTTEVMIPIVEDLEKITGQELFDEDVATLLLAGIITDTGSFQNANTTPKSFDWAAYLIAKGARQQEIIQKIYKTKPLSTLKLWGRVLSKIQIDEKHKLVWSTVTQKDFQDTESDEEHVGEIIDDLLSNAPGAEVILLLKEKSDGMASGSIRTTNPSVDASDIASMFGGGGHNQAAGFKVKTTDFPKTYEFIIEKIREYQANRLNIIDEVESASETQDAETVLLPKTKAGIAAQTIEQEVEPAKEEKSVEPEPKKKKSVVKKQEKKVIKEEAEKSSDENPDEQKNSDEPGIKYKFER